MTDNRRIIIRQSSNSLSFSMRTAQGVTYEPYELNNSISIAANLREALQTVALLQEPVRRAVVMVDTPVLLVPLNLYQEDDEEQLYRHVYPRQEQQMVLHAVLPDLNCVAIFTVLKDLHTVCSDAFDDCSFMPAMTPVWQHLHKRSYTGQRQKLYAYFHESRLEVIAYVQNRFKFYNAFDANNANDALYYILAVWKQLAMTPEHDELYLVGDIPDKEAFIKETEKFVKRVFLIHPSGEFNRAPATQIEGMPYDLMLLFVKGMV